MTELILTTPQQLREIISECLNNRRVDPPQQTESVKKYAYSIKEAAAEFHVSTVTFQSWKNKGFVQYVQHGRKVIIDLPGTMALLASKKAGRI